MIKTDSVIKSNGNINYTLQTCTNAQLSC